MTPVTARADPLVAFVYDLLRDELPGGRAERIVVEAEKVGRLSSVSYSNPHLAAYAAEIVGRLRTDVEPAESGGDGVTVDELVVSLVDLADRWRSLSQIGRADPEACKALSAAADALVGALRDRGVLADEGSSE